MPDKDGWNISFQNLITLIIITILVTLSVTEIVILIFDMPIQDSITTLLAFEAFLFTGCVVGAQYSDNERIRKYNLDRHFLRASQNFIISVILMLFIYSFSKLNILIGSKNEVIGWIGSQLIPISTPFIYIAFPLLVIEVSWGTWILLKATFQAYKKIYEEK